MPILMMLNLKGGVAKTTTAVAVAECLASAGHRTLLVDADHQSMAGELLLGPDGQQKADDTKRTLHDLMMAVFDPAAPEINFDRYVTTKVSNIGGGLPKLSVLPCSVRIDDFYTNMAKAGRKPDVTTHKRLRARGRDLFEKWARERYDFVIIDCPPSLAMQVKFLLSTADGVVVPCVPDALSVRGSVYLMAKLREHTFKVPGVGTLWSMHRSQVAGHVATVAAARTGDPRYATLPRPFETVIPHAAKISEATELGGRPATFRQKYTSEFAGLYQSLCDEIVQRTEWASAAADHAPARLAAAKPKAVRG